MRYVMSDSDGSTALPVSESAPVIATSIKSDIEPNQVLSGGGATDTDPFAIFATIAIVAAALLLVRERTARLRSKT